MLNFSWLFQYLICVTLLPQPLSYMVCIAKTVTCIKSRCVQTFHYCTFFLRLNGRRAERHLQHWLFSYHGWKCIFDRAVLFTSPPTPDMMAMGSVPVHSMGLCGCCARPSPAHCPDSPFRRSHEPPPLWWLTKSPCDEHRISMQLLLSAVLPKSDKKTHD